MLRNLRIAMLSISLIPLTIIAAFSFLQYHKAIINESMAPISSLTGKTRHSFQLFLEERLNLLRAVSSIYTVDSLCNPQTLNRLLRLLRSEFGGFVDLGLIDGENGNQVAYSGPYDLLGKDYSGQTWFHEVMVNGSYISDVFLGYRKFPHFVMAVLKAESDGRPWILRATFNTGRFEDLISSMGLAGEADSFVLNKEGVLQTRSRFFGDVLGKAPIEIPPGIYTTMVNEVKGPNNERLIVAFAPIPNTEFFLVVTTPKTHVRKTWLTLRSDLFITYILSMLLIALFIFRITGAMVTSLMESDKRREMAFRELEHTHKLSSIGRLAAGVAHEINNPMAVINERAGLMKDILIGMKDFEQKEKFLRLIGSITSSVERCRAITHRLLGFAKKMDISFEQIDLNELLREVSEFVTKEAMLRNTTINFQLDQNLPRIYSDKGQLQQVFLNILTNAIQAISGERGEIIITSWVEDPETVAVSVKDNGVGMSEEVLKHIFEPFFTTKKGYGTGLGLPITYGIINKMGGKIKAESKEGVGTTFYIYLPIRPKEVS